MCCRNISSIKSRIFSDIIFVMILIEKYSSAQASVNISLIYTIIISQRKIL